MDSYQSQIITTIPIFPSMMTIQTVCGQYLPYSDDGLLPQQASIAIQLATTSIRTNFIKNLNKKFDCSCNPSKWLWKNEFSQSLSDDCLQKMTLFTLRIIEEVSLQGAEVQSRSHSLFSLFLSFFLASSREKQLFGHRNYWCSKLSSHISGSAISQQQASEMKRVFGQTNLFACSPSRGDQTRISKCLD